MSALYRRGKIYWARAQRQGREQRRSLKTADRSIAEKRLRQWLDELDATAWGDKPRRTFGEASEKFIREHLTTIKEQRETIRREPQEPGRALWNDDAGSDQGRGAFRLRDEAAGRWRDQRHDPAGSGVPVIAADIGHRLGMDRRRREPGPVLSCGGGPSAGSRKPLPARAI
jgi:hypothetical protein